MTSNIKPSAPPPEQLLERCCRRPWEAYAAPFKLAPGVWYVSGNDWVACYLIETGDGLILIDSAMHETLYLMLESIRQLGFEPGDIKKLLISHAHIDHIGGARAIKELTGAEVWCGARDLEFLRERRDLIGGDGQYTCGELEPDELYADDRPITLGGVTVNTLATPGHTPGCTSFFFDVRDETGRTLRCGMHGGLGLNTLNREYFAERGQPASLREEFKDGLRRLDRLEVDICLPSHTNQVEILTFAGQVVNGRNPFINRAVWHDMLNERLARTLQLERDEA